jgi:hypothetical protein
LQEALPTARPALCFASLPILLIALFLPEPYNFRLPPDIQSAGCFLFQSFLARLWSRYSACLCIFPPFTRFLPWVVRLAARRGRAAHRRDYPSPLSARGLRRVTSAPLCSCTTILF